MNKQNQSIPVITIDGPSGSGKGTISFLLAKKLGWHFLDSGAIYRVLAYAVLQQHLAEDAVADIVNLAKQLPFKFVLDAGSQTSQLIYEDENVTEKIREEAVGVMASKIAVYSEVRQALLQRQREFLQLPGLVTDGRDMGTVVFPYAPYKFFFLASVEERAMRRFKQLQQLGQPADFQVILQDLTERDARDQARTVAPLKPAADAIIIDTTHLSVDAVIEAVMKHIVINDKC